LFQIHIWKEDEERLLLNLRFDAEKSFNLMKSHEVLWGKITEKLNAENVNVSKVQVINKSNTLKKKYKEVIDDNSKTGNQRTNWKYFEVFNEAYGNKTGTQAALTFDSERDEKLKKGNPKNGEGSSKKKDVKVPKSNKRKSEMEDIVEKVQAQNDKLLGTLQKQHNQKMRKMDRFLTIFEKSVGESKEPPKE
jgi:hypothetical protein